MKFSKFRLKLWVFKILNSLGLAKRVDYIGTGQVLPKPLSAEEEAYYLENLKNDESIKGILIERNLRLVVYIARKFDNTKINIEDLISIGTIGLIKAVNTFDTDKKVKLATYASRCIENEILMYLRKTNRIRSEISFDEPLNIDWDGNELLLSDILGTEGDIIYKKIETQVDKSLLNEAIEKLSVRERTIVKLRFGLTNGEEKTQKEVADLLGISQSYISRLEKRIMSRLEKEMDKFV